MRSFQRSGGSDRNNTSWLVTSGKVHNPPPPEGLRRYISLLLESGFEPDEIQIMVKDNPERLLGLD